MESDIIEDSEESTERKSGILTKVAISIVVGIIAAVVSTIRLEEALATGWYPWGVILGISLIWFYSTLLVLILYGYIIKMIRINRATDIDELDKL